MPRDGLNCPKTFLEKILPIKATLGTIAIDRMLIPNLMGMK
jgi:hypothetical protein